MAAMIEDAIGPVDLLATTRVNSAPWARLRLSIPATGGRWFWRSICAGRCIARGWPCRACSSGAVGGSSTSPAAPVPRRPPWCRSTAWQDRAVPAQREPRHRDARAWGDGLRYRPWPGAYGDLRGRLSAGEPIVEQFFAHVFANEEDGSAEVPATLVAYLASGAADVLSGRNIDASGDLARMAAGAAEIEERDLHVSREGQ